MNMSINNNKNSPTKAKAFQSSTSNMEINIENFFNSYKDEHKLVYNANAFIPTNKKYKL